MTKNFTNFIDGVQYFICEYCLKEIDAKKRVEHLCGIGKKAHYEHSDTDYVVWSSH
ncbi:MAG: hypothetical protein KKG64_02140 [Firmicutes bacterium]|nr:hypothetical protein [Bacillota bacterium]